MIIILNTTGFVQSRQSDLPRYFLRSEAGFRGIYNKTEKNICLKIDHSFFVNINHAKSQENRKVLSIGFSPCFLYTFPVSKREEEIEMRLQCMVLGLLFFLSLIHI